MGSFIEKAYWFRANMLKQYFTGLALVKAKIWGIQMGRKCTFRGPVLFYKTPKSIVLIGENCRFNSLSYFNFRGLDHPTILQTGKANAKIKIGNNYNYIDLLLFNTEYNCYVVIELKVTELKKEHIGQIQVYMNYVDKVIKKPYHDTTIGIIISKKNNQFIIEYCSDERIFAREFKITS